MFINFNFLKKKHKGGDLIVAKKMLSLETSAKSRGLEFNLSFNTVRWLLNAKECYYTGIPISKTEGPNKLTIDRLDNDQGYVEGNVVPCVQWFNLKKGNLTVKEIKLLYDKTKHL
jgi:hypothetical protein